MKNFIKINGLVAAAFCPMNDDFSLNLEPINNYALRLISSGIKGVYINGTTGEGLNLNFDERIRLAEEWIKYKSENFKILINVTSDSIEISSKLGSHAQLIGADAISATTPLSYSSNSLETLIHYFKKISLSGNDLPFYFYHIPSVSKCPYSIIDILKEFKSKKIDFAGIKYTSNDLMQLQQCIDLYGDEIEIFNGFDEILLSGLAFGLKSAIGSTYNYMSCVYDKIISQFNTSNLKSARKNQIFSVKVVEILLKHGGAIRAGKEIMNLLDFNLGPTRLPSDKFQYEESTQLKHELNQIGFFDEILIKH